MSSGLIPGTFDPPTLGHLDVIERAAKLCRKLIIGVAHNQRKQQICFSSEERVAFLKELTRALPNVEVVRIKGLMIDFVKEHGIDFLIRGLRAFSDMEYEFQMALANKKLGEVETIFFMADGRFAHISSSLIRDVAMHGHHLKDFVPAAIEPEVSSRLHQLLAAKNLKD